MCFGEERAAKWGDGKWGLGAERGVKWGEEREVERSLKWRGEGRSRDGGEREVGRGA